MKDGSLLISVVGDDGDNQGWVCAGCARVCDARAGSAICYYPQLTHTDHCTCTVLVGHVVGHM